MGLEKITKEDLAYTAGIIDGEGTIIIDKFRDKRREYGKYYYTLRIRVAMIDFEVPEWLEEIYGGSTFIKIFKRDFIRKPQAVWSITSRRAVDFLKLIKPYIKIKHKQIDIAIEFEKTCLRHGGNRKYEKLTPEICAQREILSKRIRDANQRRI